MTKREENLRYRARQRAAREAERRRRAVINEFSVLFLIELERVAPILRHARRLAKRREYEAQPENVAKKKARDQQYRHDHADTRRANNRIYGRARYWRKRDELLAKAHTKSQNETTQEREARLEWHRIYYKYNAADVCAAVRAYRRRMLIEQPEAFHHKKRHDKIIAAAKRRVLRELGVPREAWPIYIKAINQMLRDAKNTTMVMSNGERSEEIYPEPFDTTSTPSD